MLEDENNSNKLVTNIVGDITYNQEKELSKTLTIISLLDVDG